MSKSDPKCPDCGCVMIQKFDYRPGPNDMALAIPTGEYRCMKCIAGAEPRAQEEGN